MHFGPVRELTLNIKRSFSFILIAVGKCGLFEMRLSPTDLDSCVDIKFVALHL